MGQGRREGSVRSRTWLVGGSCSCWRDTRAQPPHAPRAGGQAACSLSLPGASCLLLPAEHLGPEPLLRLRASQPAAERPLQESVTTLVPSPSCQPDSSTPRFLFPTHPFPCCPWHSPQPASCRPNPEAQLALDSSLHRRYMISHPNSRFLACTVMNATHMFKT